MNGQRLFTRDLYDVSLFEWKNDFFHGNVLIFRGEFLEFELIEIEKKTRLVIDI